MGRKNNNILNEDDISVLPPTWQHPILPPNALQGSLLFVLNNFVEPPQSSANFKWIPMEDIIGVANVKIEYDEVKSLYTLYKTRGHLNNDGEWIYEWEVVNSWTSITEAVKEALENLVYFSYRYDTSESNVLKVYGIRKDGTEDLLCNISFVSKSEFDNAMTLINRQIDNINEDIRVLRTDLNSEIERATTRENELEEIIERYKPVEGDGISIELI